MRRKTKSSALWSTKEFAMHVSGVQLFWFILIGLLWAGYFFLEGFDFGVGMLMPFVAKTDLERRALVNAIGPTWDGNEVWLIVAGGATFASFPLWYSTMFSSFYLAMFIILVALILRGVAFEYRGKGSSKRWKGNWDRIIFFGSLVPAFLWGVAFGDLIYGIPLNAAGTFTGNFFDLLQPYAIAAGVAMTLVFLLHGSLFLSLKLAGDLKDKVVAKVKIVAPFTTAFLFVFLGWTYLVARNDGHSGDVPGFIPVSALLIVASVSWLAREKLFGWAFIFTGAAIVAITATIFMTLYPDVIMSSTATRYSLSIVKAASQPYTLHVMTVVAIIFTPFVIAYQAWSYWIFRKRITLPTASVTTSSESDSK